MGVLGIVLLVVFVIVSLFMILFVLVQDEHGEGIGGVFGGGSGTAFGSRSGNFLTKTTAVLGALFLLGSLGLAVLNRTSKGGNVEAAARAKEGAATKTEWWNDTTKVPQAPAVPQTPAAPTETPAPATTTK
jgi:preprotein translocase subunit SecG